MLVLTSTSKNSSSAVSQVVIIFGLGLIGAEIARSLRQRLDFTVQALPFTWTRPDLWEIERGRILDVVGHLAAGRIEVVWAAGPSGFGAGHVEMSLELAAFEEILRISEAMSSSQPSVHQVFHLVSSAGGLFEGQQFVTADTWPAPKRPYGNVKLAQEELLRKSSAGISKLIYRLSSVYGHGKYGSRVGLITALLGNAMNRSVSKIFGETSTIRDYVFSEDIGSFIADMVVSDRVGSEVFLLASGKPTSIHEVFHLVKSVTGRDPYVMFDREPSNSQHITFLPSSLPDGWKPTDLKTGIRKVAIQTRSSFIDPSSQKANS